MNNLITEKLKLLKLFVWDDWCPDYSSGVAFAIAESEQQAREMVMEKHGIDPKAELRWGEVKTYKLTDKVVFAREGCS